MTRPIAYSYARFSTAEQERGDSERRQIDAARQYAELQGFVLDESIGVDRGKSGFTGKNIATGVLGEFIRRVEAGKIACGSALLVENPDRVSRQPFSQCWPYYQRILAGGVEIHFLSVRRVLKPNHTFVDVLQIGVEIDRGNSESQMKSQRLGAVWGQKKHHSTAGVAITNKLPGWLDGTTGAPMTVNKVKAKSG
jgi:DNA invertase Pin-like site-specific DNA recombinase